jgi:hypothetical protein
VRYPHLPAVGAHVVPELTWQRSPNQSSRGGRRPRLVFVHRWGGGTFAGVVGWLRGEQSSASAHVVYAGELGKDAGRAAQLVGWSAKAWTECELNPVGLSIESEDAIWLGHDPAGFARLARMVALLCHLELDACRAVSAAGIVAGTHGFTRHRDAGALGCGHLECPTHDDELWRQFSERVVAEYRHGGFRKEWGRA